MMITGANESWLLRAYVCGLIACVFAVLRALLLVWQTGISRSSHSGGLLVLSAGLSVVY